MSVIPETSQPMGSSILPPKREPKTRGSTVHLPDDVWERLDEIAEETRADDPNGAGYSRNEVIAHFIRWAMREYETERRAKKKAKAAE